MFSAVRSTMYDDRCAPFLVVLESREASRKQSCVNGELRSQEALSIRFEANYKTVQTEGILVTTSLGKISNIRELVR